VMAFWTTVIANGKAAVFRERPVTGELKIVVLGAEISRTGLRTTPYEIGGSNEDRSAASNAFYATGD